MKHLLPVLILLMPASPQPEEIKIDEEQIQLLCLKRTDAGYLIHLYNSSSQPRKTRFTFIEREIMVELDPFELKALHYSQGILEPCGLITLQDTL